MQVLILYVAIIFMIAPCNDVQNESGGYALGVDSLYTKQRAVIESLSTEVELDSATSPLAAKVDNYITGLHKNKRFNGTILIAKNGKIIYKNALGEANFKTEEPLNINSAFQIASVTKQFTAMGIMILKKQGKLDYDDKVSKYLPGFPYTKVTIRHLLNHTSGVLNIISWVNVFDDYWDTSKVASNADVTQIFRLQQPPMHFRPGYRFFYNNVGYVILGRIIEKASGLEYHEFMKTFIFQPLQMNNTCVYDKIREPEIENRVMGHQVRGSWWTFDDDDPRNGLVGEKGIYSTVEDLYRWDQALYYSILVPDSTLKKAFQPGQLANGNQTEYGFGWRIPNGYDNIVYHFGEWRGFKASLVRLLDERSTIIILTNTGEHVNVRSLSNSLIQKISPGKFNGGPL